jgi:O-antigen ligase
MPALALAAIFAAQSALTFARGGIGLAFAGTCAAMFVLMRGSRRGRMTVLVVVVLSLLIGRFVVEPRLDEITHGKLAERYTSTKSSGRDVFISSELQMFRENPVLGVGPGVGTQIRDERGLHTGASHTEYTRMLAEHGLFGALALACLIALGVRAIRQAREFAGRALAAALVVWVALSLSIYGVRLVAPAFALGLAFTTRLPSGSGRGRPLPDPISS